MSYKPKQYLELEEAYDYWCLIIELLGEKTVLDNVFSMLDTDTITCLIEWISTDYEIELN